MTLVTGGFSAGTPKTVVVPVMGAGVEITTDNDRWAGFVLEIRLEGAAAEEVYRQMSGPYAATMTKPDNAQDEALAAARRDAQEAKRRAEAAETKAAELDDQISDYQGEIKVLREDLEAFKPGWRSGFANGGIVASTAWHIPRGGVQYRTESDQAEIYAHLRQEPWHTTFTHGDST